MSPLLIAGVVTLAGLAGVGLGFATRRAPRLLGALVWAFAAALLVTSGLVAMLSLSFRDEVRVATMTLPLVWVVFEVICFWTETGRRALTWLAVFASGGALATLTARVVG
ncbi:MAG: hypothetical protein AAF430_02585 [Myxococcota bacterium]